jgi:hypothetical protein
MAEPTKRVKRLVREYAARARAEELRRALMDLLAISTPGRLAGSPVANWPTGFTSSTTVRRVTSSRATAIRLVEQPLARAIAEGILDKSQVPAEVLEYLAGAIGFYEEDARS